MYRDKKSPGRNGKILSDHRQDGNAPPPQKTPTFFTVLKMLSLVGDFIFQRLYFSSQHKAVSRSPFAVEAEVEYFRKEQHGTCTLCTPLIGIIDVIISEKVTLAATGSCNFTTVLMYDSIVVILLCIIVVRYIVYSYHLCNTPSLPVPGIFQTMKRRLLFIII